MYECTSCCITICPECICAAQLKMTSLVKIDPVSRPTETFQQLHSLPEATNVQPVADPVTPSRTVSMPVRVKRKPIPGTVGSSTTSPTSPRSPPVRQERPNVEATASQPTSPAVSYRSEAGRNVSGQYQKLDDLPLPTPTPTGFSDLPLPTPTAALASSYTSMATASYSSAGQASNPPTWTKNTAPTTSQTSPNSTQEPLQGFSQLQQVHTAPEPANFASGNYSRPKFRRSARSQPISFSSIKRKHPATINNIRRASHASVATAKKLSHNPWIRAGVKIGAKYALSQVIGDVASDLMVNNVADGVGSVASGLFSNNSGGNPTDLTSGLVNSDSSPTDITSSLFTNTNDSSNNLASGLFNNNSASPVDLSSGLYDNNDNIGGNIPDPSTILNNSNAYGNSIGDYPSTQSLPTPSFMYQAPGFTTVPDTTNLNASFLNQAQYSPVQDQFITSYGIGNTSPGSQDLTSQYDLANAQLNMQLAAQQNAFDNSQILEGQTVNSAIQVSQAFCADETSNASVGLANAGAAV
jgi:hypothetical protein